MHIFLVNIYTSSLPSMTYIILLLVITKTDCGIYIEGQHLSMVF